MNKKRREKKLKSKISNSVRCCSLIYYLLLSLSLSLLLSLFFKTFENLFYRGSSFLLRNNFIYLTVKQIMFMFMLMAKQKISNRV